VILQCKDGDLDALNFQIPAPEGTSLRSQPKLLGIHIASTLP
jgi:hypothetical protein